MHVCQVHNGNCQVSLVSSQMEPVARYKYWTFDTWEAYQQSLLSSQTPDQSHVYKSADPVNYYI